MKIIHITRMLLCCSFLMAGSSFAATVGPVDHPQPLATETTAALRCFYKDDDTIATHADLSSAANFYPNLYPETTYKWAVDENNNWYYVTGTWYSEIDILANVFYTTTQPEEMRRICNNTLQNYWGLNKSVAMYAVAGWLGRSTVNYMVWSADPGVGQPQTLSNIVSFGDSVSDMQNMFNGSDWELPTTDNYYAGRFSNGKNWLDYLSALLQLPVYNWAIGGAGAVGQYANLLRGVDQQVASWVAYKNDLATRDYHYNPANTLFTMLIGANDVISYGTTPKKIVKVEGNALRTLIDNGAKNILVLKLPDVSNAPLFLPRYGRTDKQLVSSKVKEVNKRLVALVDSLRKDHPDVNIQLFDTYAFMDDVLQNNAKYGIKNSSDSCLKEDKDTNFNYTDYRKPRLECAVLGPDTFVFWDLLHPTTHTHCLLANNVYSSVKINFSSVLPQQNNRSLSECELPNER